MNECQCQALCYSPKKTLSKCWCGYYVKKFFWLLCWGTADCVEEEQEQEEQEEEEEVGVSLVYSFPCF